MFVSVKFNPQDTRKYTYAYSGDRLLKAGDFVVVETHDGMKAVEVVDFDLPKPSFPCKHIKATLEVAEVLA